MRIKYHLPPTALFPAVGFALMLVFWVVTSSILTLHQNRLEVGKGPCPEHLSLLLLQTVSSVLLLADLCKAVECGQRTRCSLGIALACS